jgi:hypothetical protein
MKFEPEEDMYIITDMIGNIQGWTKSVNRQLKLQDYKDLKLAHRNIILTCPHLIDFIFPKRGEVTCPPNTSMSFDQNYIFYSPHEQLKGFQLYEEKDTEL